MEQQNPLNPTPVSEWRGMPAMEGTDLLLPSGNVARIRSLSPTSFLDKGMIPDPLSDIVAKAIQNKKGMPPAKIKQMAQDVEKVQASLELFDRVLSKVAIAPIVLMPPTCTVCGEYFNVDDRHSNEDSTEWHPYNEGERRPDVLYADQVALPDKIFIFQFCTTGVRDLEAFRSQLPASLGGLRQ